jgi:hypothetical protein
LKELMHRYNAANRENLLDKGRLIWGINERQATI